MACVPTLTFITKYTGRASYVSSQSCQAVTPARKILSPLLHAWEDFIVEFKLDNEFTVF